MFEQDVAGLIKALRANKKDENTVIQKALAETRLEIKEKDLELKSSAILKLVYLEMLGHSISFASFAIVECMASPKFHIKSIGYLAASQCFDKETEVAVLVVNLVKKDLKSPPTALFSTVPSTITIAHLLSTLSAVALLLSPELARDLSPELLSMLSHSRPQIRRQTMLVLWKAVLACPAIKEIGTGLEDTTEISMGELPWIERLRERLGDTDMGVVSATVNVICELARKDPKTYLPLAPELFGLLKTSSNNWMLIKIIKLFAVLTPEEPRLVRKLVAPLRELIETTPAMSLLYECIQTSIVGGMLSGEDGQTLAIVCVDKLKSFLDDADQNLRYIALLAMGKIMPTHPELVARHYDQIMQCADDSDSSIRLRAMDLLEGIADQNTLEPIIERLMSHLRPKPPTALQALQGVASIDFSVNYKSIIIDLILRICSKGVYSNVTDFEWFIDVLLELSRSPIPLGEDNASNHEERIGSMLIDVAARVKAVRRFHVQRMAALLSGEQNEESPTSVLGAAAYICGEYCEYLENLPSVMATLFSSTSRLSPSLATLYLHNGIKIFATWLASLSNSDTWDEKYIAQINGLVQVLQAELSQSSRSNSIELKECASSLSKLLEVGLSELQTYQPPDTSQFEGLGENYKTTPPLFLKTLLVMFTGYELLPVNPKAQGLVAASIDLEEVIFLDVENVVLKESSHEVPMEVDDFGRRLDRHRAAHAYNEGENMETDKKKKKKSKKKAPETQVSLVDRPDHQSSYHDSYTFNDPIEVIPVAPIQIPRTKPAGPKVKERSFVFVDTEGELPEGLMPAISTPRSETPASGDSKDNSTAVKDVEAKEAAIKVVKKKKKKIKDVDL